MKTTTVSGAALAVAAASLFISNAAIATDSAGMKVAMGHCMAANTCKGLSACKGGNPGLNACKGQGFSMTAEAPCKKAGFKFEKM